MRKPAPSAPPAVSSGQTGQDQLLQEMQRLGIPLTRENYLDAAYLGEAPEPLPAELEEQLPRELQKPG
jgi:hypothetical protein